MKVFPSQFSAMEVIFIVLFFTLTASLPSVIYYNQALGIVLCMLIFPALFIIAVLLLTPIWTLGKAIFFLIKRDFSTALQYLLIFPIGISLFFAGRLMADFYAVETIGSMILNKVQLVRNGEAPPIQKIFVSTGEPKIAFYLSGGWLDVSEGIAYDDSDSLEEMLKLKPKERPEYWQRQAVDVLSCQGEARRIGKHFYIVSVSTYSC